MKRFYSLCVTAVLLFTTTASRGADDAKEIIGDIITVVGLKPNFEIKAVSNIPNAAAITLYGKRFIAYNPQFIDRLNTAAGNKWASVSVLAHEIGHHLNGHTLKNTGSQPPLELEADEFSGFVLQKMGASLSQAQAAMKLAASYRASHTHPGQTDRLLAIEKGWNQAGGAINDMAKYSRPAAPVLRNTPQNTAGAADGTTAANNNAILDSRNILATVDFPSDRSADYYVTTRFNFVKVMNGQLYLLGKLLRTNSTDYPFVMKGAEEKNTLFVDRNGRIVTASRQFAGYLKKSA